MQQHDTCRGQPWRTPLTLDQLRTQFALHLLNCAAQRRLGDAEPTCRTREAQLLGYGLKISQMTQFHDGFDLYRIGIKEIAKVYFRYYCFCDIFTLIHE